MAGQDSKSVKSLAPSCHFQWVSFAYESAEAGGQRGVGRRAVPFTALPGHF